MNPPAFSPSRPLLQGFLAVIALVSLLSQPQSRAADGGGSAGKPAAVQHVKAKEAQKLIGEKKLVVLDIRTPGEFAAGHIAGATNINFRAVNFEAQIAALPKDGKYLVHCASGGRSGQSLPIFQKQSFQNVYHLDGGIQAWEKASLPVVK